jgi:hypothetical protein
MRRDDGRSEGHPVMGWIRVESLRLNIIRSVRELDVHWVLLCEKADRTDFRRESK